MMPTRTTDPSGATREVRPPGTLAFIVATFWVGVALLITGGAFFSDVDDDRAVGAALAVVTAAAATGLVCLRRRPRVLLRWLLAMAAIQLACMLFLLAAELGQPRPVIVIDAMLIGGWLMSAWLLHRAFPAD